MGTVCTFFLKGFCCYGDQCNRAHIQPSSDIDVKGLFPFSFGDKWAKKSQTPDSSQAGLMADISGAGWSAEELAELGITGLEPAASSDWASNKPNEAGWTKTTVSKSVAGWANPGGGGDGGGNSWKSSGGGGWQGGGGGGGWQG